MNVLLRLEGMKTHVAWERRSPERPFMPIRRLAIPGLFVSATETTKDSFECTIPINDHGEHNLIFLMERVL